MGGESQVWADVLNDVVARLEDLLGSMRPTDWQVAARNVGWSCRRTAQHISGDFAHYAGQVVVGARDAYVPFSFDTSRASTTAELRQVVVATGRLLASAVVTTDPESVGWHPHGYFTPAGFAAMGATEAIVHGHDIAAAIGAEWAPDPVVCERVLSTIFPVSTCSGPGSALAELLSQTGRGAEPREWNYTGAAHTTV